MLHGKVVWKDGLSFPKGDNTMKNFIRSDLFKTGDAFLTRNESWVGLVIRLSTFAWWKWNHVASYIDPGKVFEITVSPSHRDIVFGDRIDGARCEGLLGWYEAQPSKIWCLKLKDPLNSEEVTLFREKWVELHKSRIPYDYFGAVASAMPWLGKRKTVEMFCSAAHVCALTHCGRLPDKTNWSEWHPNDVAKLDLYHKPLRIK